MERRGGRRLGARGSVSASKVGEVLSLSLSLSAEGLRGVWLWYQVKGSTGEMDWVSRRIGEEEEGGSWRLGMRRQDGSMRSRLSSALLRSGLEEADWRR
ncbi:hypothetical protein MA16_Dca003832 [Dendrobium catenatum]|uniref:Uncharacterized protein n=1 Tax=Dendrobium catenatum TaxID=906689 RepID=A0A2I0X1M8_9ASPA|nr:hypothetical protein MA16_Dca003832 [Dendrobium catenatum]